MPGKGRPPGHRWSLSITRSAAELRLDMCWPLCPDLREITPRDEICHPQEFGDNRTDRGPLLIPRPADFNVRLVGKPRRFAEKSRLRRYPCVKLAAKAAYCASGRASAWLSPYPV